MKYDLNSKGGLSTELGRGEFFDAAVETEHMDLAPEDSGERRQCF